MPKRAASAAPSTKHDTSTHDQHDGHDRCIMNYKKIEFPGTDTSRISLSRHQLGVTGVALFGSIPLEVSDASQILGINERVAMEITNFKDMYLAELQELVSAEGQLADALLRMAAAASHPALKRLLLHHRAETEIQNERLVTILRKHGASATAHTDQAMQALITETKKMLTILKADDLRDAGLIASAQKLEHYEIAAYGTAAALAGQLDLRDEQKMLHLSLEEERRADAMLTQLAKREVNPGALAA
jgi:ferritin-like metal-binding protein YciE